TACWDSVLTNIATSVIDPAAPLDIGAYHAYSTGNQDVTNGLSQDPASAIQLAHPMVKDSAEVQNLSTLPDRRFLAKVTDRKSATATVPDTFSLACLKSALAWIRDRKSTRLNSSHVAISYAVFCLKKKKKKKKTTRI